MSRNHNPEIQVTFREKRALITLASTLVVYGAYFVLFGRAWLGGERASFGFVAPMAAAIAILIVLQIVSFAVAAAAAPSESRAPYDERDRLIDLQASRAGFYALQAGVFVALAGVFLGVAAAVLANGLLAVMVLGEVTHSAWQVVGYRRSAA
jgi:hypothetical protein